MDNLTIRPEQGRDYDAIGEVNRLAFGGEEEALLVRLLRNSDAFVPGLSLVAVKDGKVIGHALFSRMAIEMRKDIIPALALAPVAVLPAFQRKGVGSALIRCGLEESRRLGHRIVIVVGHPEYYPRFGFSSARAKGFNAPFEVPDEAFMVLELVPGALAGVSGTIRYPPAFSVVGTENRLK